jgi:DNA-binding MarR family transcriptional regulator
MTSRLQDEIKQTKPFRSVEEEAALSIARTSAVLDHAVAEVLKPHGITPTQYNALRILRGAGGEGLCRNEVRDRLVAQVPDATRLLDRLEQMGLIVRAREGTDRRYVRNRITPAGLDLVERVGDTLLQVLARRLGHMGPERLRTLIELLAEARRTD